MSDSPWPSLSSASQPSAPDIGPFASNDFLRTWWDHFAGDDLEAVEIQANDALLTLVDDGETLRFAGHADVTDYHTPYGDDPESLAEALVAHPRQRADLNSLPLPQAQALADALENHGASVDVDQDQVTAVAELPATFDDYLGQLSKKQRHELRRKRRRYALMLEDWEHETYHDDGFGFEEFIRLHRSAPGDKGQFMTTEMEEFFAALIVLNGWRIDLLRHPDGATATVFGYVDAVGYYLYNSSFDAAHADASPGWVLLSSMIETAISEGMRKFDYLKGDEAYKFKLGAEPRQLATIEATW